jgi:hypothetical protein
MPQEPQVPQRPEPPQIPPQTPQMGWQQPTQPMPQQSAYMAQSYPEGTPAAPGAPAPYAPQEPYVTGPAYGSPEMPSAPPPKKRSRAGLVVGGVALVLLIVVGAVAFTFINRLANRPAVAVERLLPTNTLAYVSLDPSIGGTQKAALDKIGEAFKAQPGFAKAWANITKGAMEAAGQAPSSGASDASDFDILSQYLGDSVTIAVLPPSTADLEALQKSMSGEGSGSPEDVLLKNVAGVLDLDFNPLNKKGPISDLKSRVDNLASTEVSEKYRDTDIHKYVTDTTTIYFSLLGGTSTVIVGGKPEPLHVLIDQFKDNKGLSEDARFKTLAAQVPSDHIAAVYVNLTEIYKDLAFAEPSLAQSQGTKADGAVMMTLSAQDDGLQIDVASQATIEGAGVKMNPNAHPDLSILSDVPADSLGLLAGTDLKTAIQSGLEAMRKQSQASGGEDMVGSTLADFEKETGLSLENDILPWMGGDYALSASVKMPAPDELGEPMPSVVFQMKLSDADHQKAVDALEKVVNSPSVGSSVEKVETSEGTFYSLSPGMGMLVGVAKDRLLVVYETEAANAESRVTAVMSGLGKGLGAGDQWKSVSTHLPKDSNAVVYMDINGAREKFEASMDSFSKDDYETNAAPFVRPFKYLAVGSAPLPGSDGSLTSSHSIIFLGISK